MFTLRKLFSYALAGSILLAGAGCQNEAPTLTAPDSSSMARAPKPPKPPTGSLNLRVTGNTSWSVSFAWDAMSGTASYRIRDNWNREITVPGTQTSVTWKSPHPPLQAGATYSFSMYALSSTGVKSANSNTVSVTLPLDNTPPTVPAFTVSSIGARSWYVATLST